MRELGAIFLRPDRRDERPRFGGLGGIRQWVESIIDTAKGQLSLERHGAHTMPGLLTRIAQRLLALAASLWHNWNTGTPGRHLTAYELTPRPKRNRSSSPDRAGGVRGVSGTLVLAM
jgi:hypothetical protein